MHRQSVRDITADWTEAWWSREDLGSEGAWEQSVYYLEHKFPRSIQWVRCATVLVPWAPCLPTLEKKIHRYLVVWKVENQGLSSLILFSLVFLLLSKFLDAKPKSWLHPMFPSEETALVIENRNWFFYSHSWDAGKIPVCALPWLSLF